MPVVVDFAGQEQTGTQTGLGFVVNAVQFATVAVTIAYTNVPGDLYVVSVLFQFGNADTQVVQFISEFADQFVISTDSAFGQSLGNDLSHFITGHGLVAFEGAIRIPINDAGSSQFGNSAVSPVASRQVGERVGSKSSSATPEP